MQVKKTVFPDVLLIEQKTFADNRGFFYEGFHAQRYQELGIAKPFVQDNLSRSFQHVIRGLHYQLQQPQAKLVSVIRGIVYDVVVDIRYGSPTFGHWFGQVLSDDNHLQMYIPEGFAHGFCVLSDHADFLYKCTDYYLPHGERGIHWQDPDIAIEWPTSAHQAIVSAKDQRHPLLSDVPPADLPIYRP